MSIRTAPSLASRLSDFSSLVSRLSAVPSLLSLLSSLFFIAAPLPAQQTSDQITVADLKSRLYRIADDSMMGRGTGTLGNFKAAEYVAAEFKRIGLKPAGDNGSWFQVIPFFQPAPARDGMATTIGGKDLIWHAGTDYVLLGRPAMNGMLRDAPVMRGGVANDSTTWPDAAAMAGKMVVLDVRERITAPARLFANPRFAQAAAIALVELDKFGAGGTAFMQARPALDTTRGRARPVQLVISSRMSAAMTTETTVTGDGTLKFVPVPYAVRNVVGILPGRDPKLAGEYVAVTGHNDHVGICGHPVDHDSLRAHNRVIRELGLDTPDRTPTADEARRIEQIRDSLRKAHPVRADSICNGADDDGTGTVAILELAEAFASIGSPPENPLPRRSLLFVSHAAEEFGLVGSAWFTDHPTVPIDSIVAEIDEDMIGRGMATDLPKGGPTYLEVVGARRTSNEFADMLEAANKAQKVPFVFNYEFDAPGHPLRYFCRADHYNYARYGIPAVALSRGEHRDYHQVTDEAQYIDYEDLNRVVHMVFDAVVRMAGAEHRPALNAPRGDPHARCVQ